MKSIHHENFATHFLCYHCFPKKLVEGLEKILLKDVMVQNLTIDSKKTIPSKCRCCWWGRKNLPPKQTKLPQQSKLPQFMVASSCNKLLCYFSTS